MADFNDIMGDVWSGAGDVLRTASSPFAWAFKNVARHPLVGLLGAPALMQENEQNAAIKDEIASRMQEKIDQGASPALAFTSTLTEKNSAGKSFMALVPTEYIESMTQSLAAGGGDVKAGPKWNEYKDKAGNIHIVDETNPAQMLQAQNEGWMTAATSTAMKGEKDEYENYVAETTAAGEQPMSRLDWNLTVEKAPSTTINLPPGPKAIFEVDVEQLKQMIPTYNQARATIPMFDIAEQAAKRYPATGTGGGLILAARRLLNTLGKPDEGIPSGELLNALSLQIAARQRLPGSGQMSDREYDLYREAVFGLGRSAPGNLLLIRVGKKLMQREIADYDALKKYVFENGSSVGFVPNDKPVLTSQEYDALLGIAEEVRGGDSATQGSAGQVAPFDPGAARAGAPSGALPPLPPGFVLD